MSLMYNKSKALCSIYTLHKRIKWRSQHIIKCSLAKHHSTPGCQTVHCRLQPCQTTLVMAACLPLLSIKLPTQRRLLSTVRSHSRCPAMQLQWLKVDKWSCCVWGVVFTPPLPCPSTTPSLVHRRQSCHCQFTAYITVMRQPGLL